jgi:alpha-tubulin suppressor-like RCC1 family protein
VTNFLVPKRLGEMGAFAYPFGRNDIGQLGMGSARPRRFPTLADDVRHRGLDLDRLAVGSRSTIGISNADGKAYAWGDGSGGRLGTGDAFPRTSPTAIGALGDAVVARVAAHAAHAAAVTEAGHLWCWGANDGGQLGRPRRTGRLRGPAAVSVDPVAAAAAEPRAPRRVTAGGLDRVLVRDVAVGDAHTVALDSNGTLWTFGSNSGGQLGRLECLIQNPADGAAGCETWGAPAYGVLETPGAVGLVMKPRAERPGAETAGTRLRDADLKIGVKFRFVAAAARYTVAISDGPPPGSEAETALASHAARARDPGGVPRAERPPDPRFPPNATVMGQSAFDEAAGAIGGRVYTFGWGDVGQLGHGTGFTLDMPDAYRASVPTPVAALEGVDVVQVSAGPTHVAAVDRAGRVYTWGAGSYGQLGHGDRRPAFAPRVVRALLGVNVTSVAAGTRHTVAVDDMGETYAWGSNEFGELGLDPPPPLDPTKGPPYLTLRGWTQDDNSTNVDETSGFVDDPGRCSASTRRMTPPVRST